MNLIRKYSILFISVWAPYLNLWVVRIKYVPFVIIYLIMAQQILRYF